MLCPESSSKRPALTREAMAPPRRFNPRLRSHSRSGRPRWSPPCRPAAYYVLLAGRFRLPQRLRPDSDGCRWLLRPGACLRAPWPPVAAACFCAMAQRHDDDDDVSARPLSDHHFEGCQVRELHGLEFSQSSVFSPASSWSASSTQPLTHYLPHQSPSRGPGPGDDTPVPVRRPISSRLCTRGLAECQTPF